MFFAKGPIMSHSGYPGKNPKGPFQFGDSCAIFLSGAKNTQRPQRIWEAGHEAEQAAEVEKIK